MPSTPPEVQAGSSSSMAASQPRTVGGAGTVSDSTMIGSSTSRPKRKNVRFKSVTVFARPFEFHRDGRADGVMLPSLGRPCLAQHDARQWHAAGVPCLLHGRFQTIFVVDRHLRFRTDRPDVAVGVDHAGKAGAVAATAGDALRWKRHDRALDFVPADAAGPPERARRWHRSRRTCSSPRNTHDHSLRRHRRTSGRDPLPLRSDVRGMDRWCQRKDAMAVRNTAPQRHSKCVDLAMRSRGR